MRAEALYSQQSYQEAVALLEPAHRDEPENHFVLEAYGRALFRADQRPRSFEIYGKLLDLLEAQNPVKGSLLIDMWFIDTYWKRGIMHLDRGEWDKAAFEISRAFTGMNDPLIIDQALGYLTKAFFHIGDHEVAWYYARETLRHNPKNQYVLQYMNQMRSK